MARTPAVVVAGSRAPAAMFAGRSASARSARKMFSDDPSSPVWSQRSVLIGISRNALRSGEGDPGLAVRPTVRRSGVTEVIFSEDLNEFSYCFTSRR